MLTLGLRYKMQAPLRGSLF